MTDTTETNQDGKAETIVKMPEPNLAKRFYKEVTVVEYGDDYSVQLDGRNVKTPSGDVLAVPVKPLADIISDEWQAQEKYIKPSTMPMMQFVSTWKDRVIPNRDDFITGLLRYAETDLVCYRADDPDELITLQIEKWQPLLDWAREEIGADFKVTTGIIPVEQPQESIDSFAGAVKELNDAELTSLSVATDACGSIIIALALVKEHIDSEAAYELSQLDELYQASLWGEDYEAIDRRKALKKDIESAALFLRLIRD